MAALKPPDIVAPVPNDRGSALLIVDVQKDFCPGGALPVPNGDRVVPVLNQYIADASLGCMPIYASRDWHPPVTRHFKAYGGKWPRHCLQDTDGAGFHADLRLPASTIVVTKGQAPDSPGYSALDGLTPDGKTLLADLGERHIVHLYVGGLATEYCVKQSVLDARLAGLEVTVLGDGIAGIDVQSGDSAEAIREMEDAGAEVTRRSSGGSWNPEP